MISKRGEMDKKLMFSFAPFRLQLITDAADNMVIYLHEPCQICEVHNYSN